jgi:predicted dienelactone hydrolase
MPISTLSRHLLSSMALAALAAPLLASAQTGMMELKGAAMPITVVYPTAATASVQMLGPFQIKAALGATPAKGNGRLVILSHGTGGSAITSFDLASTLAAAGFVVASPEHQGDNWRDQKLAGPESWKLRPFEVSKTIDAVMADPRFAPLLDARKVGVHGMSAGGVSALAQAGGQWSMASLVRHCGANLKADAGFCLFGLRTAEEREKRAQSYAVTSNLPDFLEKLHGGPAERDARIAAVALSVPVAALFTDESLAAIRIPVGIVEATGDDVLLPRFHSSRVLKACGSCKAIDTLTGANHFDVLSPWPEAIARPMAGLGGGAFESKFDRARLPASYQRIAAFFEQNLISTKP